MSHIVKFTKQHSYSSSAIHLSQSSRVKLDFSAVSSSSLSLSRICYLAFVGFVTWRWRSLVGAGILLLAVCLPFVTGLLLHLHTDYVRPFCLLSSKHERTLCVINPTFVRWPTIIICSAYPWVIHVQYASIKSSHFRFVKLLLTNSRYNGIRSKVRFYIARPFCSIHFVITVLLITIFWIVFTGRNVLPKRLYVRTKFFAVCLGVKQANVVQVYTHIHVCLYADSICTLTLYTSECIATFDTVVTIRLTEECWSSSTYSSRGISGMFRLHKTGCDGHVPEHEYCDTLRF